MTPKNTKKLVRGEGCGLTGDLQFSTENDGFLWSFRGALHGKRGGLAPRLSGAKNTPRFRTLFFRLSATRFFNCPLRAEQSLRDLCTPSVGAPVGRDVRFSRSTGGSFQRYVSTLARLERRWRSRAVGRGIRSCLRRRWCARLDVRCRDRPRQWGRTSGWPIWS
jgi:hypothetical protein